VSDLTVSIILVSFLLAVFVWIFFVTRVRRADPLMEQLP
jgi:hypothetical protein